MNTVDATNALIAAYPRIQTPTHEPDVKPKKKLEHPAHTPIDTHPFEPDWVKMWEEYNFKKDQIRYNSKAGLVYDRQEPGRLINIEVK